MQTPWHEMSFLQKLWAVAKALASTPVSYTPTDSDTASFFDDDDNSINSPSFSSSISNDDSPTRGLRGPTSIYYSSMHDDTSIHSPFDD